MPTIPLPADPTLEKARKVAKDFRDAVRRGDPDAIQAVTEHHPDGAPDDVTTFQLTAAQHVIARRYRFASWAKLKHHLDLVRQYSRLPDEVPETTDPATEFLRLTCLGDEKQWAGARTLLAEHPEIRDSGIHLAAATADPTRVRALLTANDRLSTMEGGPFTWPPLLYLANAGHDRNVSERATLETARLLLAAGADPNAGYLWHGLPTPFTVLTAVLGGGEQTMPPHPHWKALARLLLESGADPNDGQGLYNRQFQPSNEHLELLFEFGLGTGNGGPWQAKLGDALESPTEMLRQQLWWAITHGMVERVRLIVEYGGADLNSPFDLPYGGGQSPIVVAKVTGNDTVADFLRDLGATVDDPTPLEEFIAAALAGDTAEIAILRGAHPGIAARAIRKRPGLMVWAAGRGLAGAVRVLAELGFDINAMGRSDVPREQPWHTALHVAAGNGDLETARTLLDLGADPNRHDKWYDATPLGWAEHFEKQELIDLLTPLTAAE